MQDTGAPALRRGLDASARAVEVLGQARDAEATGQALGPTRGPWCTRRVCNLLTINWMAP